MGSDRRYRALLRHACYLIRVQHRRSGHYGACSARCPRRVAADTDIQAATFVTGARSIFASSATVPGIRLAVATDRSHGSTAAGVHEGCGPGRIELIGECAAVLWSVVAELQHAVLVAFTQASHAFIDFSLWPLAIEAAAAAHARGGGLWCPMMSGVRRSLS